MVEVVVCWGGKFECMEVDVIESFVINVVCFVGVFDKLVNREGSVVGFYYGVGYFWRWDNGKSVYDFVGVFFVDFVDEQCFYISISVFV